MDRIQGTHTQQVKSASRSKIKRNPVGKLVTEQMKPLLDRIDTATAKARSRVFIDCDWSEGYVFDDGNPEPVGSATVSDCTTINVGINLHGRLDAMSPVVPQMLAWLKKCVDDLEKAQQGVSQVKENRNIRALRVLAAENEVIA